MRSKKKGAKFAKFRASEKRLEMLKSPLNFIEDYNKVELPKENATVRLNAIIDGENFIVKIIKIGKVENIISKRVERKQSPYIRGLASILDLRGTRYIGLRSHHLSDRILLAKDLRLVGQDMRRAIIKLKNLNSKIKHDKNLIDVVERV